MSRLGAGADISANVSPGSSSSCTPADHLTAQHVPCFKGAITVCASVCFCTREAERERRCEVFVFSYMSVKG